MIDEAGAVAIARARAAERNWAFVEPVATTYRQGWFGRPGRYEIRTNFPNRGAIARFTIDATTGRIESEGYIPR